jgi:60 kDa SS-A/Ro ribonucleoprotein
LDQKRAYSLFSSIVIKMKFNTKSETIRTENKEGYSAYSLSPKMELVQRLATWFVNEPKFYGNKDEEAEEIRRLIKDIASKDPEFVLKLASYCREKLLLRTAPIFLLVEASLIDECKPFIIKYMGKIITRADQLTETVSYLTQRIGHLGDLSNKGSMPASLKKGLSKVITEFTEYELSKYNRDSVVKMRDVINLVHPKPKDENQSRIFKQILENKLESADTWEVLISTKGSTKENWQVASTKMGYMALLRNLMNFLRNDIDLTNVITKLGDTKKIINSKQYPFRFLSAYNQIKEEASPDVPRLLQVLDKAIEISTNQLPKISGTTAIFADHSGSMQTPISAASTVERLQTADMLLAIAHRMSERVITGVFSDDTRIVQLNPSNSILQNADSLRRAIHINGTSTWTIFEKLMEKPLKVDRIIILTDEESNGFYNVKQFLDQYRQTVNPSVYCYIVNLAGYGTTEVPESDPKSIHISGFTEKILQFIPNFESDKSQQLKEIESYAQN